jgi:cytochrome bd-type quinol oxidase subunit 1
MIYGVMRTADASTITLPLWQLVVSFVGILLVYLAITVLTLMAVKKVIQKGPPNPRPLEK